MKMRILTIMVLASLTSEGALAASEGGDTWSDVQSIEESSHSAAHSAAPVAAPKPDSGVAFEDSEGGDTWSAIQAIRDARVQAFSRSHPGRSTNEYAVVPARSEGGDTWSRFVDDRPTTGSAGVASAHHVRDAN